MLWGKILISYNKLNGNKWKATMRFEPVYNLDLLNHTQVNTQPHPLHFYFCIYGLAGEINQNSLKFITKLS